MEAMNPLALTIHNNKQGFLVKTGALRITLNVDDTPVASDHTLTHHTRKLFVY